MAKLLDEQIASLVRQHGYGDVRLALIQHGVEMRGAQREAHLQRVLDETGQERADPEPDQWQAERDIGQR